MDAYEGKFFGNRQQARNAARAAFGIENLGLGDVYLVKKTTDVDYNDVLQSFMPAQIFGTITLALAACTAGNQDNVLICPGTYTEALTVSKADVRLIGLGSTPHSTVIDGDGGVCATITGVDVSFENLHFTTTGAAIVCMYGTGLVGGPSVKNCHFTQIELTSLACIQIAGATTRGVRVTGCAFLGASGSADALNLTGKQAYIEDNSAEDLNTTEATCFGSTTYGQGTSNLAV